MILSLPIYQIIALIPPLLLSLTLHEYAHARTALAFGDPTAKYMGRVTLNPLAHLDPLGTLALFFVGFGWAKPVPVNPLNLHPRRLGNLMVSLAGPLSNLCLAIAAGLILRAALAFLANVNHAVFMMLLMTLLINIALCVFNLIPLYPLDGHHILREILPWKLQEGYMHWQLRYGRLVLLALLFVPGLLATRGGQGVPDPIGWLFSVTKAAAFHLLGF